MSLLLCGGFGLPETGSARSKKRLRIGGNWFSEVGKEALDCRKLVFGCLKINFGLVEAGFSSWGERFPGICIVSYHKCKKSYSKSPLFPVKSTDNLTHGL